MLNPVLRKLQIAAIVLLAGCLLAPAAGCAFWSKSDDGPGDPAVDFGAKMRKPTAPGQVSGFDTRAKEIEKNLGVR